MFMKQHGFVPDFNEPRHGRLFELIRQANRMSEPRPKHVEDDVAINTFRTFACQSILGC